MTEPASSQDAAKAALARKLTLAVLAKGGWKVVALEGGDLLAAHPGGARMRVRVVIDAISGRDGARLRAAAFESGAEAFIARVEFEKDRVVGGPWLEKVPS
jgi:hypothetical protein